MRIRWKGCNCGMPKWIDSWMDGGILQHSAFQLGGQKYFWDVIEGDIGDNFIIGIDFLKSVKCKIDLEGNVLKLGNGAMFRQ